MGINNDNLVKMDLAAKDASDEFDSIYNNLLNEELLVVNKAISWMDKYYGKSDYKRLSKILLAKKDAPQKILILKKE